ncbi:MAG: cob(I)yrinic acid a,c-diamide adenosyltransferase [Kiritimatiellia bacterium]|jgi:cob(I)alamin adenosyltransferase|nr:cob(I)yrinic acid a,c-diamide adenosyltransferase [Kiritimatiellia bacterium]
MNMNCEEDGGGGCLHVYTGDGKGKTTAAMGLVLRACGAGLRVFVGQFIKGRESGEVRMLKERCPEVTAELFGRGRFPRGRPSDEDISLARRGLERLREVLQSGEFDMVVADEANGAVHAELFGIEDLLSLIDARRPEIELVMTGRNAHPQLIERADLVTEMCKIKHPFDSGVPAREGVEF